MRTKVEYTSSAKFKSALVIFSFMGQVAWVVENMYFNVFIYKMFNASAQDISAMVIASAVTAALTTLLIGCLADCVQKRKLFISLGYILWGFSILIFCLLRSDILEHFVREKEGLSKIMAVSSLGISLVIIMDCVMTFFGSSANDASFNAWLTDCGSDGNRGKIEGINSMMPLIAILAVFGSFMAFDLDQSSSWVKIYLIIGSAVIIIGILGFFLIEDHINEGAADTNKDADNTAGEKLISRWSKSVIYSFRPSVIKQNPLLYLTCVAFALFGTSIQIFMPYLILYYEKSLGMANYVLVMAPAIIVAAVVTAFYGKVFDRHGFEIAIISPIAMLIAGYIFLYFFTNIPCVFIGSLLMMSGYLTGMAVFGAKLREQIPQDKTGMFQGIRIIAQVLIPGIIGPAIGAAVLKNAQTILNSDGTTSFLPNNNIFLAALIAIAVLAAFLVIQILIGKKRNKAN
ncbi:MAG: MFS transporter [Treponemataceae bacterium]|nr:MFS transporter [Treponemataceae bacterium]